MTKKNKLTIVNVTRYGEATALFLNTALIQFVDYPSLNTEELEALIATAEDLSRFTGIDVKTVTYDPTNVSWGWDDFIRPFASAENGWL